MKNELMPAFPLPLTRDGSPISMAHTDSESVIKDRQLAYGLTKLEYFAGLALQGIMSNQHCMPTVTKHFVGIAEDAVLAAQSLIAELEKAQ